MFVVRQLLSWYAHTAASIAWPPFRPPQTSPATAHHSHSRNAGSSLGTDSPAPASPAPAESPGTSPWRSQSGSAATLRRRTWIPACMRLQSCQLAGYCARGLAVNLMDTCQATDSTRGHDIYMNATSYAGNPCKPGTAGLHTDRRTHCRRYAFLGSVAGLCHAEWSMAPE